MARAQFRQGQKIERWGRNLDKPTAALKQIGALMTAESQRAFKAQRFGRTSWAPRGKVNTFGIIADFHAGKRAPPKRRFQTRPALRDTGRLAASIASRIIGTDTVEVGSNLPYAGVHHTGGTVESKTITAQVQRLLWAWLKTQGSALKRKLGFLLNKKFRGKKLTTEVPKRPIVGLTRRTMKDIEEVVGVKVFEVR